MKPALLKQRLTPLCREAGIARLSVFGSAARGDEGPDSDVDLLVRFKRPVGMFELIGLEQRMTDALGRRVDPGTENSLHPLLRQPVLNDLKIIYEA
jgi:predicted nucleotidyltransferase